jgi:hypothetical protein
MNNVALNVCIGLIFVYLLYSLLATIVKEAIAQWLSLRGRMLVKGIRNMLEDRAPLELHPHDTRNIFIYIWKSLQRWWASAKINWSYFKCPLPDNTLTRAFYQHPGIKYLSESSWNSKPAYIDAVSFATTMIQLLHGEEVNTGVSPIAKIRETLDKGEVTINDTAYKIDPDTLRYLRLLMVEAPDNIEKFRNVLEHWYNITMDRVSGWYKQQTQIILFAIGLVIAVIFNVDTITLTSILARDKTARESLVQLAINSTAKYDTLTQHVRSFHRGDGERQRIFAMKRSENDTAQVMEEETAGPDTVVQSVTLKDPQMEKAYSEVIADMDQANHAIGLGWDYCDTTAKAAFSHKIDSLQHADLPDSERVQMIDKLKASKEYRAAENPGFLQLHPSQKGGFMTFFGWVLTAFAISLGAPFWFDLLNKVIKMRSTGNKPDEK